MVAWYWLLVAAWIGTSVGVGAVAMLIQGRREERTFDFIEKH
jgi:hypothetical protein